jgi:hypothetical protein
VGRDHSVEVLDELTCETRLEEGQTEEVDEEDPSQEGVLEWHFVVGEWDHATEPIITSVLR